VEVEIRQHVVQQVRQPASTSLPSASDHVTVGLGAVDLLGFERLEIGRRLADARDEIGQRDFAVSNAGGSSCAGAPSRPWPVGRRSAPASPAGNMSGNRRLAGSTAGSIFFASAWGGGLLEDGGEVVEHADEDGDGSLVHG